MLDALASPESPFAAGSGAAIAGAVAAAVTSKVARRSGFDAAGAQADALRSRLARLAATDAQAFAAARSALDSAMTGGDERADFRLGRALSEAAAAPLAIAEACADVAEVAGCLAHSAEPSMRPDATAAALLAAAGAGASAALVDANLAVTAGDDRAVRARAAAEAASASASV